MSSEAAREDAEVAKLMQTPEGALVSEWTEKLQVLQDQGKQGLIVHSLQRALRGLHEAATYADKNLEQYEKDELVEKLDMALNYIEKGAGYLSLVAGMLPGDNAQTAKVLLGTAKTSVAMARPMVPVAWKGVREAVRACLMALLRTQAALLTVAQLYATVRQSVGVSVGTSTSTTVQEVVTVPQKTVVVAQPLT